MIEKIQFEGITRRPSDLMTKEGACEESLNVVLDAGEIAPVVEPEDVTSLLVGTGSDVSSNEGYRYVYIHKTGSYTNYIVYGEDTGDIRAFVGGTLTTALLDLSIDAEALGDITSIGNTLILSTDKHLHYILFKDGEYVYLGTRIPEPFVDFNALPEGTSGYVDLNRSNADIAQTNVNLGATLLVLSLLSDPLPKWKEFFSKYDTLEEADDDYDIRAFIDSLTEYIWSQKLYMNITNRADHKFTAPVFVRSAVKLYDGTYIYQSVPYLMHCGRDFNLLAGPDGSGGLNFTLGNVFTGNVTITYPGMNDWSDIIRSVDIFLSSDIQNPKENARLDGIIQSTASAVDRNLTSNALWFKFLGQSSYSSFDDIRDEILSKVNFFLVESKDVDEIGNGITFTVDPIPQDELLVKETLPDDNLSHHTYAPSNGIMAYNSRLAFKGLVTEFYSGHPYLQSVSYPLHTVEDATVVEFRYYIRTEDGASHTVIGKSASGIQQFYTPTKTWRGSTIYGVPCGFLFYPDPRCYRCDIYYGTSAAPSIVYSVPMKEHPGLNGSYAICSLLEPVTSIYDAKTITSGYPTYEDKIYIEDNKLVLSEASNPFVFQLTNRQTFTDAIVSVATTTKALSTGQFGQFPLYVFTKGGIWAVPLTDTGSMAGAVPLSRDVALSADSVSPIDQAIIFVTVKGVMLLTGSEIQDISPEMDGRHYSIEDEVLSLLEGTTWEKYKNILSDTTPFISFVKTSKTLYDYAGKRLIFFNTESTAMRTYQYVYKLDTGSWHKTSLLQTGLSFSGTLNGYPDALACFNDSIFRICNLSARNDSSSDRTALSQVIISRPVDFGLQHVKKTIKRLFARGIFEKGNVKLILLGSPDGLNYHVIHSLRGPSNNILFRIMVFSTLGPKERLSFLEVDYESRYADKPR